MYIKMKNNLMKLLAIVTLCVSAANALAHESTEAVSTNNGIISLILEILLALIGGAAAVYFCWHIVVTIKKKKEEKSTSTTGTESPIVNVDTHGANSGIDNKGGIMGNNNTIQNGLSVEDVLKLTRQSQPTQPAGVLTDFEQDKQTVESLMSCFSVSIVEEFLFGNNQNRLDNRLFEIRDAWYSKYNPVEPIFNNPETERIMKAFYVKFSQLIELCANYYDPMTNSDLYSKIRGLICDSFDDRKEDEAHFEEVLEQIKVVQPVYKTMKEFIIRRYKINLDELSAKFER